MNQMSYYFDSVRQQCAAYRYWCEFCGKKYPCTTDELDDIYRFLNTSCDDDFLEFCAKKEGMSLQAYKAMLTEGKVNAHSPIIIYKVISRSYCGDSLENEFSVSYEKYEDAFKCIEEYRKKILNDDAYTRNIKTNITDYLEYTDGGDWTYVVRIIHEHMIIRREFSNDDIKILR